MYHYQWPEERIIGHLGDNGFMLVALDGEKLVGTAALGDRVGKIWYANGPYAYACFDSIIPEYAGRGIFRALDSKRESLAISAGYNVMVFDTHCKNVHRIRIAKKMGYRPVHYFRAKSGDHYNIVMVKWLRDRSFSPIHCWVRYHISKFKAISRFPLKKD